MFPRPMSAINAEMKARAQEDFTALQGLIPQDLLERLVRATDARRDAELAAEDPVLIEGSPDDIRAALTQDIASLRGMEISPELRERMDQLTAFVVNAAGKKLSELTVDVDEARMREAREEQVQSALTSVPPLLVVDWLETLRTLHQSDSAEQVYRLNDRLLPVDPPSDDTMLPMQDMCDWDAPMAHALSPWLDADHARELYNAFAANLRARIDERPSAPLSIFDELRFGRDAAGYYVTLL